MTGGHVCCFLCKATIFYRKDDQLRLQDHLRSEHDAEGGLEYLIAGCLMNSDERQAIVDVVKNREPKYVRGETVGLDTSGSVVSEAAEVREEAASRSDDSSVSLSALVPETTLQEVAEEVTEPRKVDTVDRVEAAAIARSREGSVAAVASSREEAVTEATVARSREEVSVDRSREEVTVDRSREEVSVDREAGECSPPRAEERLPVEFPCLECGLSFNLKIRLNRHLKNHEKKREMQAHMRIVKSESLTPSKTPSKSGKSRAPKNHIEPPPGEGVACPECGKRFRSRGPMLRHYEDLHQPGEYPCRGCGRVFTSKNKVSSHFSRNCKHRMSL